MNEIIKYKSFEGDYEIVLSNEIVRQQITTDENITDAEIDYFMKYCKAQRLNPFIKEVYITKYGNYPATQVIGKEVNFKRAMKNPDFNGLECGLIIENKANNTVEERPNTFYDKGKEELLGSFAIVHRKSWDIPLKVTVNFNEYVAQDNQGKINKMWSEKPATMISKVAKAQALREAFPEDLSNMYVEEEMNVEIPTSNQHVQNGGVKAQVSQEVDITKLHIPQLQALAAQKGIETKGMKKQDLITALSKNEATVVEAEVIPPQDNPTETCVICTTAVEKEQENQCPKCEGYVCTDCVKDAGEIIVGGQKEIVCSNCVKEVEEQIKVQQAEDVEAEEVLVEDVEAEEVLVPTKSIATEGLIPELAEFLEANGTNEVVQKTLNEFLTTLKMNDVASIPPPAQKSMFKRLQITVQ